MKQLVADNKKSIIIISIYHLLSQGLILLVSGRWFDDWAGVNLSNEGLLHWASEMGKPEVFPIIYATEHLPSIFYKAFIFLTYFVAALSFYFVSKKIFSYSNSRALILALVYMSIPANDIRIEKFGMPYTVGLLLFTIGFFLITHYYEGLKDWRRIVILTVFFFSFILNSLLVFYGLVLLYILWKERSIKRIIKKIDFFSLPFVFFILKNLFFPTHGIYSTYNQVSAVSIFHAIKNVFVAAKTVLRTVLLQMLEPMYVIIVFLLLYFIFYIVETILKNNKLFDTKDEQRGKNIISFFIGAIMLLAGLFPYVVAKNSSYIKTSGFDGRNSILAPFGIAMMICSVLFYICNKKTIVALLSVFLLVGTQYFSHWYVNYQAMYYWVRGLQEYLSQYPELGECKTVFIVGDGENGYGIGWRVGLSFYQYNGIFEEVYGNENRLVMDAYTRIGIGENGLATVSLNGFSVIEREWYNMTGYDENHIGIDAVVLYSNSITPRNSCMMRLKELCGQPISEELIKKSSFDIIYPEDDEYSTYVLQHNR